MLPIVALKVTFVVVATPTVLTVNVALVDPEGTVTELGTVVLGSFDERLTILPDTPAGPDSVTVPVADDPPFTPFGATEILERDAGLTVRFADCELPLDVAVMTTVVFALTPLVAIVKVALVAPDGI